MWLAAVSSLLLQAAPAEVESARLPVRALAETLRFTLVEGRLEIEPTRSEPLDDVLRLTGTNCIARLRQQPLPMGFQVHLQATVESPLIGAMQITHVFASPIATQLALDSESPLQRTSIQLIMNAPGTIGPDSLPVILHGTRETFDPQADADAPENTDRIRLESESVVRLMRDQGELFDHWMRPVAASLGSPWLFSVLDLDAARQVLMSADAPSPELEERVRLELERLDSAVFEEREAALKRLHAMGPAAVEVLAMIDPGTLSIEQASAVETLLLQAMPLTDAEALRRRGDVDYLIDLMYAPDLSIRAAAGRAVEGILGRPTGVDASAEPDRGSIEAIRPVRP